MNNFYNETLLDHNLHPSYKDLEIKNAIEIPAINSSCGDKYSLFFEIKNNVIKNISFKGNGCAISQASADLMAELLIGKTILEAQNLTGKLFDLIKTGKEDVGLGEVNALKDISAMPARVKCAELAWTTISRLVTIVGI